MTRFQIKVNDGAEQTINVASSIYIIAAAGVPALLGLDTPIDVEIWHGDLPGYGPYRYRIRENEFGGLVVEHLVKR